MPLVITDDQLQAMKRDAGNARIELACQLFDKDILSLPAAAKFAALSRAAMEGELRKRRIAIHRPSVDDLHHDLEVLRELRGPRQ